MLKKIEKKLPHKGAICDGLLTLFPKRLNLKNLCETGVLQSELSRMEDGFEGFQATKSLSSEDLRWFLHKEMQLFLYPRFKYSSSNLEIKGDIIIHAGSVILFDIKLSTMDVQQNSSYMITNNFAQRHLPVKCDKEKKPIIAVIVVTDEQISMFNRGYKTVFLGTFRINMNEYMLSYADFIKTRSLYLQNDSPIEFQLHSSSQKNSKTKYDNDGMIIETEKEFEEKLKM